MNFKTIYDLNNLINKKINIIPNDVDIIVGVPRSGMLVASIISLYLNLPLTDIDSLISDKIYKSGVTKKSSKWINNINEARKILIVEDSSVTGNSLNEIREIIKNTYFVDKVIILTIYVTSITKKMTDLYFEICETPRMFEWNYMHHKGLINACLDLDGVLCVDPTKEENDDGEKYVNFIRNAPVRIVPTNIIGNIVTSRLEKYRKDTEYWLEKNNIKYNNLIMMQFNTKEERISSGSHGNYKGNAYRNIKTANIFIESEKRQAMEIATISSKLVFCTENQIVYNEGKITELKNSIKTKFVSKIPKKIKRFIKNMLRIQY